MTADAVGGVWTFALDLAAGLARHGVATSLVTLGPPPDAAQRAAAAMIPGLGLRCTGLPLDWTAADARQLAAVAPTLAALARSEGVELLHLHAPSLAADLRAPVPVIASCHSCVTTWWRAVHGAALPLPPYLAWRSALTRRGALEADLLVAPTEAFAAAFTRAYALPSSPRVVRNGRRDLGAPDRAEDIVLTAGRLWDAGKNVAALDRAAALLPVPVLAAGPARGPGNASFEPRSLRLLGSLPEAALRALMARGPVFVSPARYEPFGLAVLEAAQAGCALVLSDIPSFRELWDGAARFVPADDEGETLAAEIRALLQDREQRAALRAAARERSRRYGVEAMAAGMLRLYAEVLAPGRTGASGRERVA